MESVMLSRSTAMAVVLAGLLAGCSGLRSQRTGPTAANKTAAEGTPIAKSGRILPFFTSDKKTSEQSTSAKTIPDNPPALYIPGSAETPRTKETAALPVALPAPVAQEPETTLPPLSPADPAISDHPLQALANRAQARWARLDAYACRIRRREAIGGQPRPEEVMVAKFRKEPFSVYLQFLGP